MIPFEQDLRASTSTVHAWVRAEYRIDLSGTPVRSAVALDAPVVVARDCQFLADVRALPRAVDLDLTGCSALPALPAALPPELGRLSVRRCRALTRLPAHLRRVHELDAVDSGLTSLPPGLSIGRWIDLGGTPIRALPRLEPGARILWRGVPVEPWVVTDPERITARQALSAPNAEVRRVLIERMGYDAFLASARARSIDEDTDRGGARTLLRVEMPGDEPLVCVVVRCPSTGNRYALRVPPHTTSCRQAVAWIAGFDDPDDYRPIGET